MFESNIYSKIDLKIGYNQVQIKEGNVLKIGFRSRLGHYEYVVIPFGLTNAPIIFMTLMKLVFKKQLDKFVLVFMDDILVYSKPTPLIPCFEGMVLWAGQTDILFMLTSIEGWCSSLFILN